MPTRTRSTVAILSAVFGAFILTTLATPAFAGPAGYVLAVADFNQDGVTDLLAEKVGGGNPGLLWVIPIEGATSLRLVGASGFPLQLKNGYEFLAVGNFNGNFDGQSQIAARKTSSQPGDLEPVGAVRLWDLTADGKGLETEPEGVLPFTPHPTYSLIGVGDLDNNGVDDFVFEQGDCGDISLCPNPGLMRAYLMSASTACTEISCDGVGTLLKIAHPLINAGFPFPHEVFGVADVDGNGFADIVLARRDELATDREFANGNLRTFLMQGDETEGITVSGQEFTFDLPGPEYAFVGFGLLDPGARADLLFEKISGTNAGLIQVRLMQQIQTLLGIVLAPELSLPYYTANLGATSSYIGNGKFDSDLNTDLVLINNTTGLVRAVLLDMDPSNNGFVPPTDRASNQVTGSTFPVLLDGIEWANRATGAVEFP